MNPRIQKFSNWLVVIIAAGYLIWEQAILFAAWNSIIESPYWMIDKIILGINLAKGYILDLFPTKWIWYVPFKILYRWALEDILFVMIGIMIIDHLKTDIIIYFTMKLRNYNKTISAILAGIGALGFIFSLFVYLLKGVIALVKKVLINTIFSKAKLYLFKTLPALLTFLTSVFPYIGGLFETIFQYIVLDGLAKWLAKYNWIQVIFEKVIQFKAWIDRCGRKVRISIYRHIRRRIVGWAKNKAYTIRTHTMNLASVNKGETFEELKARLAIEKEEKKKLKLEKRKTLGWKIQSYSGSLVILTYVSYFIWVAYDLNSVSIHSWVSNLIA